MSRWSRCAFSGRRDCLLSGFGFGEDSFAHLLNGVQIEDADQRFRLAARGCLHAYFGDAEQAM